MFRNAKVWLEIAERLTTVFNIHIQNLNVS